MRIIKVYQKDIYPQGQWIKIEDEDMLQEDDDGNIISDDDIYHYVNTEEINLNTLVPGQIIALDHLFLIIEVEPYEN